MSDHFGSDPMGRESSGVARRTANAAGDALSNASTKAGEAADKVQQAISDTTETVTEQVKQVLDRQVGNGADIVGQVASAVKRAAQELDRDAPQLASVVRATAQQIDSCASSLRDQSVDQLMHDAADFTRRQPAMVFGLAALAGFFALRTLKSTPSSVWSPPIQPSHHG
jgi:ElaB/YqjD/DUF883 family membrane-anchored ribosome-binding protein